MELITLKGYNAVSIQFSIHVCMASVSQ